MMMRRMRLIFDESLGSAVNQFSLRDDDVERPFRAKNPFGGAAQQAAQQARAARRSDDEDARTLAT